MADNCRKDYIITRLSRLRRAMRDRHLDAFLATDPQDVSYLSGFTGHDSYLLVTAHSVALITDSRYTQQARQQCPRFTILQRTGLMAAAVADRVRKASISRIGLEPAGLSLDSYSQLRKSLRPRKLLLARGLLRDMRICKDSSEQAAIRRAVKLAEDAFLAVLSQIVPGITELELAARLDFQMKLSGASEPAFSTIVACGARSSMPHAQPGNAGIKPNQPILIDFGATLSGYRCDLTRVVFLDSMPRFWQRGYETVRRAGRAALEVIEPGVSARQVDKAARDLILWAGYGGCFGHGLGHGLGRDIHEAPTLSPKSTDVLEEGMIFTIEPGIYLPRRGGIRIENDVLVTKTGFQVLSSLPDEPDWAVISTGRRRFRKS